MAIADLESLKARLSAGRFALDEVAELTSASLAAIESLQRELEEAREGALEEAAKAIEHLGDWCGGHGMPKAPLPDVCAEVIRGLAEIATHPSTTATIRPA
jgi:hypothetical protein